MTIERLLQHTGVSREELAREMFRRAAWHFESVGMRTDAAECWAEAGDHGRAAAALSEAGDVDGAGLALLRGGQYEAARAHYEEWLSRLPEGPSPERAAALLGVWASLTGKGRASATVGRWNLEARRIIDRADGPPESVAQLWETLGRYGAAAHRSDLVTVGYEMALRLFGDAHPDERLRVARAYRAEVEDNRVLRLDLDARIDQWTAEVEDTDDPEPPYRLRSEPGTFSDEEAKAAFPEWAKPFKRPTEFIPNDFEDRGETVHDRATGLTWQKSGSDRRLAYEEAQAYVEEMNRQPLGGRTGWRLPTVDELASLLTEEENEHGLYIDPLFGAKERYYWCWTADRRSGGGAWDVGFHLGLVNFGSEDLHYYVRLVLS
jgi:tetratricopeptide (TPR) repeat protein